MKITQDLLDKIYYLYQVHSDLKDIYRANAYINAYIRLRDLKKEDVDLPDKVSLLVKYESIGKSIAQKIIEYNKTGTIKLYEKLKSDDTVNDIMNITKIHGFGPKVAKKLYEEGYKSLSDIQKGYADGKLKLTKQQKLGVKYHSDMSKRIPRIEITKLLKDLKNYEKKSKTIKNIDILGSFRRGADTSHDIDILVTGKSSKIVEELLKYMIDRYQYVNTLSKGPTKFMGLFIIDKLVRHVDIIYSNIQDYPTKFNYFVGPKEFNIKIRNIAIDKGYKLSDKGLFLKNKKVSLKKERDIFDILGIKYIKPEKRK